MDPSKRQRLPKMPTELAGQYAQTRDGQSICFGYNLKAGCRESVDKNGKCPRGLHVSWVVPLVVPPPPSVTNNFDDDCASAALHNAADVADGACAHSSHAEGDCCMVEKEVEDEVEDVVE
eukprot:6181263-Amphidinium_carterae.1